MNPRWQPLLQALREPAAMAGFDLPTWDRVVPMALWTGVLGRLAADAQRMSLAPRLPPTVWRHLQAMLTVSDEQARAVRHELRHLTLALQDLPGPVLLLKGAAYAAAGLPPAAGRVFGDIDILVPRAQIEAAEASLMLRGWVTQAKTAYDQRYYRRWMHEIPPMTHIHRRSVLDVHHGILPPTARIKTRPELILEAAVPVPGWPRLQMPCAEDLLLHSATHLFHEGEWARGLRDLVDIDTLWVARFDAALACERLWARAAELELMAPLAVVTRLRQKLLGRPLPESVLHGALRRGRAAAAAMATAMSGAFPPGADAWAAPAEAWLYLRSHWLRMPAGLLAMHLGVKACARAVEAAGWGPDAAARPQRP